MNLKKNVCQWYGMCPMKCFYETGKLDQKWIDEYCMGNWRKCVRFQKVESRDPAPDWMLPDGTRDRKLQMACMGLG